MANQSFVQVAPDGAGKQVMMDKQVLPDLTTGYMQQALLTGDPADAMQQMLAVQKQQLAVSRAILYVLTQTTNFEVYSEDFEDYVPLSN